MSTVSTQTINIERINEDKRQSIDDVVAVEEPLEIVLRSPKESNPISVTMRTPGNDKELAVGFLFTEGIITDRSEITNITESGENRIIVSISKEVDPSKLQRHFYTTSSCGVCGKTSLEAVKTVTTFNTAPAPIKVHKEVLCQIPEILRSRQDVFKSTGGLHASALFTFSGDFIDLREDVGRHNALDKLIGSRLLLNEIPIKDKILLLSGRASFELIQKATMAGISIVAAIGAPSSLAIQLAEESKMTLIGFLKKNTFNVYSSPEKII